MIDLLSTHEDVEEQARCSAHLLAAVIALAVQDLCIELTEEETRYKCNLFRKSVDSLNFFYNPKSVFKTYAHFIGLDPELFVLAMEKKQYEIGGAKKNKQSYFSEDKTKIMKIRIEFWHRNPVQSKQLELVF
jgi:hypothetical protein